LKDDTLFVSANAEPVPIACSLGAEAATQRGREWSALISRALISRSDIAGGVRVELRHFPGVRGEVEQLVAGERVCCPFLAIGIEMTNAALVLTVTAPAAGAAVLDELFAEQPG
jgi:hypothetical protein